MNEADTQKFWLDDGTSGQIAAKVILEQKKKRHTKNRSQMRSVYKSTIDSQDIDRPATGEKLRSTNRSFIAPDQSHNISRASIDGKKHMNSRRTIFGQNRKNSMQSDIYSGINR